MNIRRAGALLFLCCSLSATSSAQPRGGILRVKLVNGTSGGPGSAEKVTLYRLRNEMIPAKEMGSVSGSFTIEDIDVEGERPMLLQVTSQGVNYNEPVRFGRGYEADVAITVYDVTREWTEPDLELTTARVLYRRDGPKLLVDEVYVVQNRTEPKKTFHDPEAGFRFHLPTSNLLQLHSVSARGESGMPVPQQASPLPDGTGYVTRTAFKPGETEIVVSYEVGYGEDGYQMASRVFYPLDEFYAFVAPPDVRVEAEGWENLGPEPEGRFVAFRLRDIAPGAPLELKLSGGSERAAGGEGEKASSAPQGEVAIISDPTHFSKAVVVVLMAAALGFGLLKTLYPPSTRRAPRG
ncbi:MAG: hypothetical protein ACRD3V_17345 [Vicinamibacteria bacterium]